MMTQPSFLCLYPLLILVNWEKIFTVGLGGVLEFYGFDFWVFVGGVGVAEFFVGVLSLGCQSPT
jgi:hypothetical protein